MKRASALIGVFFVFGLMVAADEPKKAAQESSAASEKAIRALVAELGEAWNKHDMKAYAAVLAEDAEVVNRFGHWIKGRDAIVTHLTGLHASPFRDHLVDRSSKVENVRFLSPEIAVVHERAKEERGQSVRTYVLQKRDGRWWIQTADIIEERTPPG
jgi:uncharacterized protein (TIGR02246 family)